MFLVTPKKSGEGGYFHDVSLFNETRAAFTKGMEEFNKQFSPMIHLNSYSGISHTEFKVKFNPSEHCKAYGAELAALTGNIRLQNADELDHFIHAVTDGNIRIDREPRNAKKGEFQVLVRCSKGPSDHKPQLYIHPDRTEAAMQHILISRPVLTVEQKELKGVLIGRLSEVTC